MDSREKVEEKIKRELLSVTGVGDRTTGVVLPAVMRALDRVVAEAEVEGERDEDGILYMKRPSGVPEGYNYMYWGEHFSTGKTTVWVHPDRVHEFNHVRPGQGHYTCTGTKSGVVQELCVLSNTHPGHNFISEEDIPEDTERGIEDRIRRLVD